jgi:hypothetical protein
MQIERPGLQLLPKLQKEGFNDKPIQNYTSNAYAIYILNFTLVHEFNQKLLDL